MQRFTYFYPDGHTEVRTQPKSPLPRTGEVWIRGVLEAGVSPDPTNVRVGEAGVRAWRIIQALQQAHGNVARAIAGYGGVITPDDIDAATWFYKSNKKDIDREIQHELEPV
jgi:hypothetical protein